MTFRPSANPYPNVAPRVYDPPRTKQPQSLLPPRECIPRASQFANVEARYAQPRERERKPREVPRTVFVDEAEHKRLAQRTVGRVGARYLDPTLYSVDEAASPRRAVEMKLAKDERLHNWRSDTVAKKFKTFDDHQRATGQRMSESQQQRKRSQAHSTVGDYIRTGSPIRHPTMSHLTEHGNMAAEARRLRSATPPQRVWHSGGVVETNFSNLERRTERRREFSMEQRKIAEKTAQRQQRTVSRSHVPRVALLAPSALALASLSRGSSVQSARSGTSGTSSALPSPPPPRAAIAASAGGGTAWNRSTKPLHEAASAATSCETDQALPEYEIDDAGEEEATAEGEQCASHRPVGASIEGKLHFVRRHVS